MPSTGGGAPPEVREPRRGRCHGHGDAPGPPEADASDAAPDSSPGDASAYDAEGGGDGGIVGPTLLTSGTTLSIKGITKDNYVVYFDFLVEYLLRRIGPRRIAHRRSTRCRQQSTYT